MTSPHATFWPSAEGPYAGLINANPKYVASTTLTAWNAQLLGSDTAEAVASMR